MLNKLENYSGGVLQFTQFSDPIPLTLNYQNTLLFIWYLSDRFKF